MLANTLLQNPISRLFSYRYHVTGTWSDPQVDKTGEASQDVPAKPEVPNETGETKP